MSLCDIPAPSQELVDKYNTYRTTFYNRLLTAYNKLHAAIVPILEKLAHSEHGQATKDYVGTVQEKPEFQAFVKLAKWVFTENTSPANLQEILKI